VLGTACDVSPTRGRSRQRALKSSTRMSRRWTGAPSTTASQRWSSAVQARWQFRPPRTRHDRPGAEMLCRRHSRPGGRGAQHPAGIRGAVRV